MPGFSVWLVPAFHAGKDTVSKKLSFDIDGTSSTFASFFFALPYYLIVLLFLGQLGLIDTSFSRQFLVLILLRAGTDTLAEGLKMHAFAYGELSLVSSFLGLSPLFIMIVSPLITEDPIGLYGFFGVMLTVIGGLILIYEPNKVGTETRRADRKAILLAGASSFFMALNSCFDRLAVKNGNPVLAGFSMTLVSCVFFVPFIARNPKRIASLKLHWKLLSLRGFLSCFMISKLMALQFFQAPYVASIQKLSQLVAVFTGKMFFDDRDFGKRLAASLIMIGGIVVILFFGT